MILVNKLLNETKWTNELWQNKQTKKLLVCQFFLLPNHSVFQFSTQQLMSPNEKKKKTKWNFYQIILYILQTEWNVHYVYSSQRLFPIIFQFNTQRLKNTKFK